MFDASSGPKGPVSKINAYRGGCVIPWSAWGKLNTNTHTAVGMDFSMPNSAIFYAEIITPKIKKVPRYVCWCSVSPYRAGYNEPTAVGIDFSTDG